MRKRFHQLRKRLLREIERKTSQVIDRAMTLTICFLFMNKTRRAKSEKKYFGREVFPPSSFSSLPTVTRLHLLDREGKLGLFQHLISGENRNIIYFHMSCFDSQVSASFMHLNREDNRFSSNLVTLQLNILSSSITFANIIPPVIQCANAVTTRHSEREIPIGWRRQSDLSSIDSVFQYQMWQVNNSQHCVDRDFVESCPLEKQRTCTLTKYDLKVKRTGCLWAFLRENESFISLSLSAG